MLLLGTAFELTRDVDNTFSGQGYAFTDERSSQEAVVTHEGCCGQALLADENGEISLKVCSTCQSSPTGAVGNLG